MQPLLQNGLHLTTFFANVEKAKFLENKSEKHVKKISALMGPLVKMSKFMTFAERRKIIKAFMKNHFSFWQFVRMFCERQTNP